jgi:hypothetical protein
MQLNSKKIGALGLGEKGVPIAQPHGPSPTDLFFRICIFRRFVLLDSVLSLLEIKLTGHYFPHLICLD